MKLRNKKTGEIGTPRVDYQELYVDTENGYTYNYKSLQKIYEEWEDCEEPKEYWYVSCDGRVLKATTDEDDYNEKHISGHKSIGNYFETKEEAEKAVENLKAWKRLKDKEFINEQVFSMNLNWCNPDDDDWKAFKLLFGGEE